MRSFASGVDPSQFGTLIEPAKGWSGRAGLDGEVMMNERSGTHPFRVGIAIGIAAFGVGCASRDLRPPPPEADTTDLTQYDSTTGDARDVFATGGCTEGQSQTCRIYLPSHNGIQPCFVGVQECVDAAWGDCGSAVLVDANADDAELQPEDIE